MTKLFVLSHIISTVIHDCVIYLSELNKIQYNHNPNKIINTNIPKYYQITIFIFI